METLPKKYIVETADACREYCDKLNVTLIAARDAKNDISESVENARKEIEQVFQRISTHFQQILERRKQELLARIIDYKRESINPLDECQREIELKLDSSQALLGETHQVLKSGGFKSQESFDKFMTHSSKLGEIPALPELELLPNITFQARVDDMVNHLEEAVANFGSVYKIGPVQITSITEHPGSLEIKWDEIEFDTDVFNYRLQMADKTSLDVTHEDGFFKDVYIGSDPSYFLRDLTPNVEYAFRVCCRVNDQSGWTAWSRIKTGRTTMAPYSWEPNPNFLVTYEGKLGVMTSPGILWSSGAQIASGSSIQFTVNNFEKFDGSDGVAICSSRDISQLKCDGTVFVTFNGLIFVNGEEKRIRLPAVGKENKLVLHCEMVRNKWRITIEVSGKAATYDWSCASVSRLFFAATLSQSQAHIHVL